MDQAQRFQTLYGRPSQLSDPHGDFGPQTLDPILAKADAALEWQDFRFIFQVGLPAATYEEGVYFIPLAFDFLRSKRPEAFEFTGDLIWFLAHHHKELQRDGLWAAVVAELESFLTGLAAAFEIRHFDAAASEAKGWNSPYRDYVVDSDLVLDLVDAMDKQPPLAETAAHFVKTLAAASPGSDQGRWYLEICRQFTGNEPALYPPWHEPLLALVTDRERQERHLTAVLDQEPTANPSYWSDLADRLFPPSAQVSSSP